MKWKFASNALSFLYLLAILNAEEPHLLIEWSQTTPDSHLLGKYYEYWESYLPYDGVVLYVNHKDYKGIYGERHMYAYPEDQWPLHALVFSGKAVDYDDFKHAVDDLKRAAFKKFKNNFILLSLYAGEPEGQIYDWWDDKLWETTIVNAKVLAKIGKESGVTGIWFDTEEYAKWSYFNFHKNKEELKNRPNDWELYKKLLRDRGRQLMRAIGEEFAGCEVVLTFGATLVHMDVILGRFGASRVNSSLSMRSLLPAFVDGMLFEAKHWDIRLIDGNENTYFFKEDRQFKTCRNWTKKEASYLSGESENYSESIQVGFGLYPCCYAGMIERHFTPKALEDALFYALKYTDKYVWTWSEKATFWVRPGDNEVKASILPHPSHLKEEEVNNDNALKKGTLMVQKGYLDAIIEGKRRYQEISCPFAFSWQ